MFSAEHLNDFNDSLDNISIRVLAEDVKTTCEILEVFINSKLSTLMMFV